MSLPLPLPGKEQLKGLWQPQEGKGVKGSQDSAWQISLYTNISTLLVTKNNEVLTAFRR
ncbi:hypothetical protein FKM82_014254 [Ascaphus truei]